MNLSEILYDVQDGIATITLNRPERLNAWTMQMDGDYREAMAEAEQDDQVRVIVVTGAGKGFCAGADMSLLSGISSGSMEGSEIAASEATPGSGNPRKDFQFKYSFPPAILKPVIGAVNGAAVGLGMVHALFCDVRFASDTAKFGTIFAQRGLIAEYGLAWMLPRLIGLNHANDLLLSGRVITASEAFDMGMVSRVVPAEKLLDSAREYAGNLARLSSPRSMRVIKKQTYNALFTDLASALDDAEREMLESLTSDDFREGIASYLEKRPPAFTGA